jgi:hypothetical protein
MKAFALFICLSISFISSAQSRLPFLEFGLSNRQDPIDIEDVPRGAISFNGGFYSSEFWKVNNLNLRIGIEWQHLWSLSLAGYGRYNHLQWKGGDNLTIPDYKRQDVKNFKYDLFLDLERTFKFKKHKNQNLFSLVGIGVTNLNTHYDVFIRDTLPTGLTGGRHFEGDVTHFGPRLSLGYQYQKIKFSLDAFVIEGSSLTGLTSLWLGASLNYRLYVKRKTS